MADSKATKKASPTRRKPATEKLYNYRIDARRAAERAPATGGSIHPLDTELIEELRAQSPKDLPDRKRGLLLERLEDPDTRGWLIRSAEGIPAGYAQVTLADTVNARINHKVRVRPHQAYLFDDYVAGRFRRQGLHRMSIAERARVLAEEGRTELLVTISAHNVKSRGAFAPFDPLQVGVMWFVPRLRRTVALPMRPRPDHQD
ncbi:MAG: GNAT family N-acetyltransferase [Actinobacteria bacterium]|nr:GNAT family N-acetyltransferase [Actinomycetota bacterium]